MTRSGNPLDSLGEYRATRTVPIDGTVPLPLSRVPISDPLTCGIRAIDGFVACGRGQRVGIFGGSGVGKTTLVGMMTRATAADLTVLALVGERGREVGDFLKALGEEGRRRSVVVVSTSDQSPLLRIRAALAATAVAEYFSARGKHVLLVLDSLTRFAMAQREIGLAAGEPPTAKGYTPSVLAMMARLIERAGRFSTGSITGFLHRFDGRRRPAGSAGGYGALASRWTRCAEPRPGVAQSLSGNFGARQSEPVDAGDLQSAADGKSGQRCAC